MGCARSGPEAYSNRRQLEALSLRVRLVGDENGETKPDCVLLDKTGELRRWYAIATVAFVGKSLNSHGGQNPVEPIAAGVPVIFGPHMENFAALADALVANNAAIQVNDEDELSRAADKLLADAAARQSLVQNAGQVLAQHRGATGRTARFIVDLK